MELPMALETVSFPPIIEDKVREEMLMVLPVRVEKEPVR
jgi:hypothetical protein